MIVLMDVGEEAEGQWHDFEIMGDTIQLKIKPLTSDIINSIRNKHSKKTKKYSAVKGGQVDKVTYDEKTIQKEMIDYVLEDFKGVGSDLSTPLEPTYENKVRVMEIPTAHEDDESVADFVFEQARKTSALNDEAFEKLAGN